MPATEFSERLFEFSVTREVLDRMKAKLLGSPSLPAIPSQRLEKKLAYDVSVKQKSGRSLFLQFKIARYQTTARAKDWTTAGSKPHFSAALDDDQYKVIQAVWAKRKIWYCAPRFWEYQELIRSAEKRCLLSNILLINVSKAGAIAGTGHHLIYFDKGTVCWVASEVSRAQGATFTPSCFSRSTTLRTEVDELYGTFNEMKIVKRGQMRSPVGDVDQKVKAVSAALRSAGVTWIWAPR